MEAAKVIRTVVIVGALLAVALYLQYRDAGPDVPQHLRACEGWDLTALGERNDARMREAMLCLHDVERDRNGLRRFRPDARLRRAAQAHADDMAERGFFAHDTPDGVDPHARMRRAGYRGSLTAENLAHGELAEGAAAATIHGWMNSPGHRANILEPRLREIGIGIAHDGQRTYWVANFGG